ncbi:MAG TPA: hypothetical protein VEJ87_05035 [Acidimicrobiales bacterium]|nr:hypothetical protein [Acidimicrobiales bacterium]
MSEENVTDRPSPSLPWAFVLDPAANAKALGEVQRRGLRAARELVDRVVASIDGPDAPFGPFGPFGANGASGFPAGAPQDLPLAEVIQVWWDLVARAIAAVAGEGAAPVQPDQSSYPPYSGEDVYPPSRGDVERLLSSGDDERPPTSDEDERPPPRDGDERLPTSDDDEPPPSSGEQGYSPSTQVDNYSSVDPMDRFITVDVTAGDVPVLWRLESDVEGQLVGPRELWLQNPSADQFDSFDLCAGELRSAEDVVIESTWIRFDPPRVPVIDARGARAVYLQLRPERPLSPGTYRGVVQARGAPSLCIALEVRVVPDASNGFSDIGAREGDRADQTSVDEVRGNGMWGGPT